MSESADTCLSNVVVLRAGGDCVDAACAAVVYLENCPLFNAGHGAVMTSEGKHELDACVMRGRDRRAGGMTNVKLKVIKK